MSRILVVSVVCLLAVCMGSERAQALPGDLDPTFGSGGLVTTADPSAPNVGYTSSALLQPDGNIVLGNFYGLKTVRFLPTGGLDTGFGSGGFADPPVVSSSTGIDSVLQSDGKIVVMGTSFSGGFTYLTLARLDAAGVPDVSFGTGGVVSTLVDAGVFCFNYARGVVLQGDGKIVAAAYVYDGSATDAVLARYDSAGVLDATFGSGGIARYDVNATAVGRGPDVLQQPSGKFIVTLNYDGQAETIRFNSDGSLDTSFGSGGSVADIEPVAIYPNGGILAHVAVAALGRYTADGVIDSSFSAPHPTVVNPIVDLQPDGRILIATGGSSGPPHTVLRLDANGTADATFGINGGTQINFPGSLGGGFAEILVQPDAKIVLAGFQSVGSTKYSIARLEGSVCGDAVQQAGETCEDGNLDDDDGCDSNCTPTACGNEILTAGEVCDDGNVADGDGCDSNCTPTGCGNGVNTFEGCDDGNLVSGDGCSNSCQPEGLPGRTIKLTTPTNSTARVFRAKATGMPYVPPFGPEDPVLHGATVRVVAACGDMFDDTYTLPASGWQYVGTPISGKFNYRDPQNVNGPIRLVVVRPGVLRVSGKGIGLLHSLATSPVPVSVEVTLGNRNFCATFDAGTVASFSTGKSFRARNAPPPLVCP